MVDNNPISNISKHLQDYFIEIKEFSDNAAKIGEFLKIFEIKINNSHTIENLQNIETFNDKLSECITFLKDNEYGIGRMAKQNLSRTAEQSYHVKFENIQILYNIYNAYYKSFKRDIITNLVKKNKEKIDIKGIMDDITNSKMTDYYIQLIAQMPTKQSEFVFNMLRLELEFAMNKYNYDIKQFIYVPNYTEMSREFITKIPIGNNIIINRILKNNSIYKTPQSDFKDYYSKCLCENDLLFKTRDTYPYKFKNDVDDFSVEFDEKKILSFINDIISTKDFSNIKNGKFVIQTRVFECLGNMVGSSDKHYRELLVSPFEKYKLCKILTHKHLKVSNKLELDFRILDTKVMTMYKNKVVNVKIDSSDFIREIQKCKGKCELKDVYYMVKNSVYKHYKFNEDNINYSIKTIVNNICIISAKYIIQRLKSVAGRKAEGYHELFHDSFLYDDDNSRLVVLENLI